MSNATIKNAITYEILPVCNASPNSGTQLTPKAYTDANILSSATNPGVTYTGTLSSPFISVNTVNEQIIYPDGTISSPVLYSTANLYAEPFLTSIDFGTASDVNFNITYAPLLSSVTATNAKAVNMQGSFFPSLTSLSFPNAIILDGSGTFSALTSLSAANVTRMSGSFSLTFPSLTTLNLPLLQSTGVFGLNMAVITTISLPNLVYSQAFLPVAPMLTTLSVPELQIISGIGTVLNPSYPLLTTYNLPKLKTAVSGSTVNISLPMCTTFSLPVFETVGQFTLTLPMITSLNLPVLSTVFAGFTFTVPLVTTVDLNSLSTIGTNFALTAATLTTLSFPALVSVGTTFVITAANLVTFSIGSTLKNIGGNFTMSGMKLNQASVDSILVSLAALDGTNGTTAYSGRTILINGGTSAAPSATGLTAKTTLQARGCTVTTN